MYCCYSCGVPCGYQRTVWGNRRVRFDGSYVHKSWSGVPNDQLRNMYLDGTIDATWHCTACQHREGEESMGETRERIGAADSGIPMVFPKRFGTNRSIFGAR